MFWTMGCGLRYENDVSLWKKTTVPNQAGGELQGPSRKYTCEEDKTLRGHNQNPVLFDDMADIFHVNECPHVIDICVDVATNLL